MAVPNKIDKIQFHQWRIPVFSFGSCAALALRLLAEDGATSTGCSALPSATFVQPGHSLASLGQSNPFNAQYLSALAASGRGQNQIVGGMIFFGGGLPLYRGGRIIGGLGVSGDTSCADHEIAKRVRDAAGPLCISTCRNGLFIGNAASSSGY